jgi:hypothetical protein
MKEGLRMYGIPNECLRNLPRRLLIHLTHLINHCILLSHFPTSWKEAKVILITLPKPAKDPKLPPKLTISLLPTTGKLFDKVMLKIVPRTCLMQASLDFVNVTARRCNLRLRYSWISKKPSILHSSLDCCINCLSWSFRLV